MISVLKTNIAKTAFVLVLVASMLASMVTTAFAADTSEFQITINPGTLSVDIVNASHVTVGSPSVAFGAVTFSFSCQNSPGASGTFGASAERIYVSNPDAADDGWTVSVAASATTALWTSAASTSDQFDFNDAGGSGCTDGGDSDSFGGQMTVDPSGGTIATATCASCVTTNISLGSSDSFDEGSTDSITIVSAAAGADDIGDWDITGVSVDQTIPANQEAHNDYAIDMTLSIVAS